ncbi:carbohydrate binding domain-containing protein [Uliginosibacterium paludis]|uniref:mannan endo-1,4-beta-mannosidase n=1 Tax=Uliginosibacterium paludis TaxID=1615952 RepID=A0ABV2CVP3_9RHOO
MDRFAPMLIALSVWLASAPAFASDPALFPFVMPWDDASANITNLSAWNDKPAGAKGFVAACGSHLCAGGERVRFLGGNIVFGSVAPDHATADKLAARMARFGLNIVRLHHMDSSAAPNGLLQKDGKTFDAEVLERLDYFIAALKREGIYADLNLHVGRKYPGFKDWGEDTPKYWKGVDNFYPPMIAMQKDYARELLQHRNPYTGNRYVDEPAIAFIEINNENGLMREWRTGGLNGITEPYRGELTHQWQQWLRAKYRDTAALRAAWGVHEQPLGAEMLSPALNVKGGEAGWNLQLVGGAQAQLAQADGTLTLSMQAPGKENWHIQLHQNRLVFNAGQAYTLRFAVRSDKPVKLGLQAMQAHAPWAHFWDQEVAVGPQWQTHELVFAPNSGDDIARLTLGRIGLDTGRLELRDVSLRPGGLLGLRADENLEAGTVAISTSADFMRRTSEGQRDWLQFLWDTEVAYWGDFQRYLKADLGAKSLIVGTQVSYSPAPIQAMLDVVDGHAYWQHPNFPGKPWDIDNWKIANTPMAGVEGGGTLADLALRRYPGKPFIVTEYNHSAPSHYQGEALPLLAAYGALQDWDGLFLYSFGAHDRKWDSGYIDRFFDSHANPVKMASFISAAALFRRGDVQAGQTSNQAERCSVSAENPDHALQPRSAQASTGSARTEFLANQREGNTAQKPFALSLSKGGAASGEDNCRSQNQALPAQQTWLDAWRAGARVPGAESWGAARNETLLRPVSIATPPGAGPRLPVTSETGELVWGVEGVNGKTVVINTPRSRALIGARLGHAQDLSGVQLELTRARNDWGVLQANVIDGSFTGPGRILVTALGQVENTGQRWLDDKHTSVGRNFGSAPTLVEGLAARITLPVAASRVHAWALDERGNRRTEIKVTGSEHATLEIGEAWRTLWYEIEIK